MEPQQRRQARQSPPSLRREFVENASPLKKGPWTAEEDALLLAYVSQHGNGNWNTVQKYSGVSRCGKSCRLRWTNHLRPHLKKGSLTQQEERIIIEQHAAIGNRWSKIANMLQGRTDNEVKNFWNTRMKRLLRAGQPLYPPDVIPIARARSQQRESEHSADESAVSLCLSGDVPGDSSTVANSLKSVSTSIQNQKIVNGEQFPVEVSPKASQAYLAITGSRTPNNKDVDESGFLLTNGNIVPSLSPYENVVTGLKRSRELPLNDMLQNTMGGPFYHFSSTNMSLQQERKVRCMYDPNLGRSEFFYQGFPYDPEPPDRKLSTYDLSMGGVSLGIAFGDMGSKLSTTPTACNFSTSVHEAQCLKVELPSVQLAESADSSSSLSSPFSASQSLPLSEVDSFGSASNECTPKNCGKLFDVLVQQNGSSPNVLSADMVEQLLVVNSNTTSPRNTVPLSFQSSTRVASSDPLAFLGGRSLTLFGDDFKATSENSSSNEDPLLALQRAEEKDNSNSKVSDDVLPLINIKTEEQSSGPYADEELYMLLAFEKPDGYAVTDLYEERAQLAAVSNRQELMGHPGGLDAIFGHNNGSLDLEQLATMSGIGNIWELGSCAWNSMPGAL